MGKTARAVFGWLATWWRSDSTTNGNRLVLALLVAGVLAVAGFLVSVSTSGLREQNDNVAFSSASSSTASASSSTADPSAAGDGLATSSDLRELGATVRIAAIEPNDENARFVEGDCVDLAVSAWYDLPAPATQPVLRLSYQTEPDRFQVIQSFPANVGEHTIQFSGRLLVPNQEDIGSDLLTIKVALLTLNPASGTPTQVEQAEVQYIVIDAEVDTPSSNETRQECVNS